MGFGELAWETYKHNIASVGKWLQILKRIWQRNVILELNTFESWELLNALRFMHMK